MRLYNHTLKTINWIFTVALGCATFLWLAQLIDINPVIHWLSTAAQFDPWTRFILLWVAIGLVLFNVLYLLAPLFSPRHASQLNLGIPGGSFTITISAIEHSLRRAVRKLPDIQDASVRLYKDIKSENKPMRLVVHCSTWEGTNVKEVTEKVKEIINLRFQEIVEVKEPPQFQIIISHIEERETKKSDSKKKTPATERPIFYGPEYPID